MVLRLLLKAETWRIHVPSSLPSNNSFICPCLKMQIWQSWVPETHFRLMCFQLTPAKQWHRQISVSLYISRWAHLLIHPNWLTAIPESKTDFRGKNAHASLPTLRPLVVGAKKKGKWNRWEKCRCNIRKLSSVYKKNKTHIQLVLPLNKVE